MIPKARLRPTVLLVDDERDILYVVGRFLRLAGYTVIEAESPFQAIAICGASETQIDLLLSDYSMPGMNGAELAESLQKGRPTLRTVFLSGNPEAEELLAPKGYICLRKPVVFSELLETMQTVLPPS
jgi:CheY-like chemotaxis protein